MKLTDFGIAKNLNTTVGLCSTFVGNRDSFIDNPPKVEYRYSNVHVARTGHWTGVHLSSGYLVSSAGEGSGKI